MVDIERLKTFKATWTGFLFENPMHSLEVNALYNIAVRSVSVYSYVPVSQTKTGQKYPPGLLTLLTHTYAQADTVLSLSHADTAGERRRVLLA